MKPEAESLASELLILPDGRILVHNLTQPFADLLTALNPDDAGILPRAESNTPDPASWNPPAS